MDDVSFVRVGVPDICMVSLVIVRRCSHLLAAAQMEGFRATFFLFYIAACINLGGSVIIVIFAVTFYSLRLVPVDKQDVAGLSLLLHVHHYPCQV